MIRLAPSPAHAAPTAKPAATVEQPLSFGSDYVDRRLGGGLLRRAVHEVFAGSVEDGSAAAGFTLMLAMRACPIGGRVIWIRDQKCARGSGTLHAVGLVELGFDPDDLVLVDAPDTLAVLRAGADSVKCGQVGAVVMEPCGKAPLLDLTASRRLSLAAAASGVPTLILRVDAAPQPSAAQTRWQVASAPSAPLPANAPGNPAFTLTLLRHRGGVAGFETRLEWNRDARCFAPLSGGVSTAAADRADHVLHFPGQYARVA